LVLSAEKNIKDLKTLTALIFKLSRKYKTRAFLVGGPVRDFILSGQKNLNLIQDFDLAVEKNYVQIGESLAKKLKAKTTHYPMFMTMTLHLPAQTHLDIAQTRKETYARPAVLPKVKPATINEDLYRRDFTINAMAMEISKNRPYLVLDPFFGQRDLKQKLIRVLHKNSFIDDPTRIFRSIRFATRFNFRIEKQTLRLMRDTIKKNYLKLLTAERVLYELQMIMTEPKSRQILKQLQRSDIIKNLYGTNLPIEFFREHGLLPTDKKLMHFFAYLPYAKWLKYPLKKEIAQSAQAIRRFAEPRRKLAKTNQPSQIYKTLKLMPILALEILAQTESGPIKNEIKQYLDKYSKVKISTTGKTLQSLGFMPGKKFSQILQTLLYLKLDGKIKNKNDEKKYLQKMIKRDN
jgi:tRNA nucleotidyltransferase (CCA-adding enzyme)